MGVNVDFSTASDRRLLQLEARYSGLVTGGGAHPPYWYCQAMLEAIEGEINRRAGCGARPPRDDGEGVVVMSVSALRALMSGVAS